MWSGLVMVIAVTSDDVVLTLDLAGFQHRHLGECLVVLAGLDAWVGSNWLVDVGWQGSCESAAFPIFSVSLPSLHD